MSVANPGATPSVERRLPGQRGDPDGAAQVLRAPAGAGDRNAAGLLADVLIRQGRSGEAERPVRPEPGRVNRPCVNPLRLRRAWLPSCIEGLPCASGLSEVTDRYL